MTITITHTFDHRTLGRIGVATVVVPTEGWVVNGTPVTSEAAIEYLATMGFRNPMLDSYAGAESNDEARTAWSEKVERIIDGTVGTRAAGVGAWQTVARQIALAAMQKNEPATYKVVKALDDAERNAKLDERIEEKRAAYETAVPAEIDRRAKAKAEKDALVAAL